MWVNFLNSLKSISYSQMLSRRLLSIQVLIPRVVYLLVLVSLLRAIACFLFRKKSSVNRLCIWHHSQCIFVEWSLNLFLSFSYILFRRSTKLIMFPKNWVLIGSINLSLWFSCSSQKLTWVFFFNLSLPLFRLIFISFLDRIRPNYIDRLGSS